LSDPIHCESLKQMIYLLPSAVVHHANTASDDGAGLIHPELTPEEMLKLGGLSISPRASDRGGCPPDA
jgi:hypothetical protein